MKFLFGFLVLISISVQAQHSISGEFLPSNKYSHIFLYKSTPTGSQYINQSDIRTDGSFSIPLNANAAKGIYKLVYDVPAEENNFDVLYNGKENIVLHFETGKELVFQESRENIAWNDYLKNVSFITNTLNEYYAQGSSDKEKFLEIIGSLKQTQEYFEENYKEDMVFPFIKANRPYIPSDYESIGTYFNHVRENFFKWVDFSNPLLQSSDFLTERVMIFVFDLVSNPNNTFYQEQIDRLVSVIGKDNKVVMKEYLTLLWHQFAGMQNDDMANYISTHYLESLASENRDKDLLETIVAYKNTSLGTVAQNFDIVQEIDGNSTTTTLHDLSGSNKYLVVFWSSTCGHCLNELPRLENYIKDIPKEELTVIAFGMEDGDMPWKVTIKNFPDFIHVLGLGKWNNPVSDLYGVDATPAYFLLDKDKKIIAKPEDEKAFEAIFPSKQ